jgi:hypothetical protein
MTLARLLAAVLLLCSLSAFAQDRQVQNFQASTPSCSESWTGCPVQGNVLGSKNIFPLDRTPAATPVEPWRLIPNSPADIRPEQNVLDPMRLDQYRLDQLKGNPHVRHFKLDPMSKTSVVDAKPLDADNTCLSIRSYVVARDSKDSDSTHPVGYSTCQPSNRYQVRSADIRVHSGDR